MTQTIEQLTSRVRELPYLGERRAEKAKELLNSVEERGYAS